MTQFAYRKFLPAGIVAALLGFFSVGFITFGYGLLLGFQAQQAPDTTAITQFAQQIGGIASLVATIFFTFFASLWTARQVKDRPLVNGALAAATSAVLASIISLIMGGSLGLALAARFLLILATGTAGGWLGKQST